MDVVFINIDIIYLIGSCALDGKMLDLGLLKISLGEGG